MKQFWDGRWFDETRYPAGPPSDDVAADLSVGEQPAVDGQVPVTITPLAGSRAPYDTAAEDSARAPREVLDPRRPWLEAGRSTDAVRRSTRAARLRSGRWWEQLVERNGPEPEEERRLRRQVEAARATAKVLEPLRSQGWVVLHDRAVAGTGAIADHLLVGPFGLVLLGNHPTVSAQLAMDREGWWWDAGVPVQPERDRLVWVGEQIVGRVIPALPGWWVQLTWAMVVWPGRGFNADLRAHPVMLAPDQVFRWAHTLRPTLSPLQVDDLAAAVETTCPPAPLR